jgi:MFS family permease
VRHRVFPGIPRPVWVLGWVSFLADLSSELVYPIIPIFLTVTLGAPATAVGVTEGVAEATANITRLVSGRWSDRVGARKPFVVAGYALAAAGKLVLCIAPAWGFAVAGRAVDRFGKGLRTAPRDALLADFAGESDRGRIFGFHRSFDTLGAIGGPLIGLAFLAAAGDHLRWAIALALIPAVGSVLVLARLPEHAPPHVPSHGATKYGAGLPRSYWLFLGATAIFMAGNSTDAFLILRAKDIGLSTTLVVLAYVIYNMVYASAAYPAGILSDRVARPLLLAGGYVVFAAVYLGFALAGDERLVWPLMAAYGFYIAATEGVTKAFVADLAPASMRSSALGLFQGITGITVLGASIAAGVLWDVVGPEAPFYLGAACALAAAVATATLLAAGALRPPARRVHGGPA